MTYSQSGRLLVCRHLLSLSPPADVVLHEVQGKGEQWLTSQHWTSSTSNQQPERWRKNSVVGIFKSSYSHEKYFCLLC